MEWTRGTGLAARIEMEVELGSWKRKPGRSSVKGLGVRVEKVHGGGARREATLMGGDHNLYSWILLISGRQREGLAMSFVDSVGDSQHWVISQTQLFGFSSLRWTWPSSLSQISYSLNWAQGQPGQ